MQPNNPRGFYFNPTSILNSEAEYDTPFAPTQAEISKVTFIQGIQHFLYKLGAGYDEDVFNLIVCESGETPDTRETTLIAAKAYALYLHKNNYSINEDFISDNKDSIIGETPINMQAFFTYSSRCLNNLKLEQAKRAEIEHHNTLANSLASILKTRDILKNRFEKKAIMNSILDKACKIAESENTEISFKKIDSITEIAFFELFNKILDTLETSIQKSISNNHQDNYVGIAIEELSNLINNDSFQKLLRKNNLSTNDVVSIIDSTYKYLENKHGTNFIGGSHKILAGLKKADAVPEKESSNPQLKTKTNEGIGYDPNEEYNQEVAVEMLRRYSGNPQFIDLLRVACSMFTDVMEIFKNDDDKSKAEKLAEMIFNESTSIYEQRYTYEDWWILINLLNAKMSKRRYNRKNPFDKALLDKLDKLSKQAGHSRQQLRIEYKNPAVEF